MGRFIKIGCLICASSAALLANPTFNFTLGSGIQVGDQAYNGFVAAAARWSNLFTDNVVINLDIDYKPLDPGILGETLNSFYQASYTDVTTALALDRTSVEDAVAVMHLQPGLSETFLQNHTDECGNCTDPYLDNNDNFNNRNLFITGAEARALHLLAPDNVSDGSITFSSELPFDFDPTDGIDPAKYDFVGVATHEIGHLLGFVSDVDDYDFCGTIGNCFDDRALNESEDAPSALDLFRFSTDSGLGTHMDMSADARPKYFSIDGGATLGPLFSTGETFGDGRQASHWKDDLHLGIMDPTAGMGELLQITANDINALDVIGWDVATPEPATWGTAAAGALLLLAAVRRRSAAGAGGFKIERETRCWRSRAQ